jgi:hypothetical protein
LRGAAARGCGRGLSAALSPWRPATGLGVPALAKGLVVGSTMVTVTPAAGFMVEAVLAFFLVTVVLSTAVAGRTGHLAPLAIGMTLVLNILMGGPLTGAAFNPAGPRANGGNGQLHRRMALCQRPAHWRGLCGCRPRRARAVGPASGNRAPPRDCCGPDCGLMQPPLPFGL